MNLKRTKKGFTIVELVIVVGVIGILSAILIPTFVNLTENAKKQALQLELRDAYAAYIAEAIDGVVDSTVDPDHPEAEVAIVEKGQSEIELWNAASSASTKYVWNAETSKWVAGQLTGNVANTPVATGDYAKFNGWYVAYYKA